MRIRHAHFALLTGALAGCGFDAAGVASGDGFGETGSPTFDATVSESSFDSRSAADSSVDDVPSSDWGTLSETKPPPDTATDGATDGTTDTSPTTDGKPPPPDAPTDAPPACAEGKLYGGHCYFLIVTLGVTGATAKALCDGAIPKAHLATFATSSEHAAADLVCPTGFHCWVGLESSKLTKVASDFRWLTGETTIDGAWCPSNPYDHGQCGVWNQSVGPPGCYEDFDCTAMHTRVLCERD